MDPLALATRIRALAEQLYGCQQQSHRRDEAQQIAAELAEAASDYHWWLKTGGWL